MVQDWYLVTLEVLMDLWQGFLISLPKIFGALIIFLIGWLFAAGIARLVTEILTRLKLNAIFEKTGWGEAFAKAEFRVNPSEFIGVIIKWVLVIVFLLAAVEILGLTQFAVFLTRILGYIPNVIVALLIFVVAIIVADILEKVVTASVEKAKVGYAKLAGSFVKWAILGFSGLAILVQLGIVKELITTLVSGIVALIVISFGLAFGLGGKEIAADILRDLRKKFRK